MNTNDLNSWAALKARGGVASPFIPALTTGTMPLDQGSSVATVNTTSDNAVSANAVPYVSGGYPHGIAPPGNPGTQNQKYPGVNGAPAPWVSVPPCSAARKVSVPPIGLTPATPNFPPTPKNNLARPVIFAIG